MSLKSIHITVNQKVTYFILKLSAEMIMQQFSLIQQSLVYSEKAFRV